MGIFGDRAIHVDGVGQDGEDEAGFGIAGVDAEGGFFFGEELFGDVRHSPDEKGEDFKVFVGDVEVAGDDVEDLGLTAVGVHQDEFAESSAIDAFANVGEEGGEGLGAKGDGAGEVPVFVGFAVVEGRQGVGGDVGGELFEGFAQDGGGDRGVDGEG